MKTTGERIKQMRLEKNWTQKDLALHLGLKNDTAIANYESNYSIPKDEIKYKLCEIFDCTMDYLMCRTEIKKENLQDPLGLAKIGFSMDKYNPPTEKQKEQIRDLLEIILKDNKKEQTNEKNF